MRNEPLVFRPSLWQCSSTTFSLLFYFRSEKKFLYTFFFSLAIFILFSFTMVWTELPCKTHTENKMNLMALGYKMILWHLISVGRSIYTFIAKAKRNNKCTNKTNIQSEIKFFLYVFYVDFNFFPVNRSSNE